MLSSQQRMRNLMTRVHDKCVTVTFEVLHDLSFCQRITSCLQPEYMYEKYHLSQFSCV